MSLNDIINQNTAKKIIAGQIKSKHIPHAYLFLGPEGVGRKKTAKELAKILNCTNKTNDVQPCDICQTCKKIDNEIHPDVQIIDFAWQSKLENKEIEKQKSIKIDTIRAIQKKISLKPSESMWKVFIIEPAEKITIEAANCLLKTLEEPPKYTILILLSKHKENLPATIVSRTQMILFCPLSENEIINYLKINHSLNEENAKKIAKISEGSISQALSYVKNKINDSENFWLILKNNNLSISEVLSYSQRYSKNANEFICELLLNAKDLFRDEPNSFHPLIEKIIRSKKLLEQNVNAQMVLDSLLLELHKFSRNNKISPKESICL